MAKTVLTPPPAVSGVVASLKKYLADRPFVTDLVSKLTITFGVVLIVGGLYLMVVDSGFSTKNAIDVANARLALDVVNWVPGVPVNPADLASSSVTAIGLVSWIFGVDLLLVGMGLWVRHRLARIIGFSVFVVAACFQFVQWLFFGFLGSPASVVTLLVNCSMGYFILSKFDHREVDVSKKRSAKLFGRFSL